MQRRDFLRGGIVAAGALGVGGGQVHGMVRSHNWDKI